MENEAGNHNVNTKVSAILFVWDGGDGPTDGLQHEREKVKADESDGVRPRFQPREVVTVDLDDAAQTKVDGSREEGWSYGDTDYLPVGY